MVNEIRQKIEFAKDELEYLIFRYGLADDKVIEQNNKIDSLVVEYYNTTEKLKESQKVIYLDFNTKKVI